MVQTAELPPMQALAGPDLPLPPQVGARSRTHADALRVAEIAAMDKAEKECQNMFIKARNADRERRARAGDDVVSDAESLISVVPTRPPSPVARSPPSAVGTPPPVADQPTTFLDAATLKRLGEESHDERAKQLKLASEEEVHLEPGQVINHPFSIHLLELENQKFYTPLSLFTAEGQSVLAKSPDKVRTIRRNTLVSGEKKNLYIDVNNPLFAAEESLSVSAWLLALEKYTLFALESRSDNLFFIRMGQHFAFLKDKLASGVDFSVILELDILLRKRYRITPFKFSPSYYETELATLFSRHLASQVAAASKPILALPPQATVPHHVRPFARGRQGHPRTSSASSAVLEATLPPPARRRASPVGNPSSAGQVQITPSPISRVATLSSGLQSSAWEGGSQEWHSLCDYPKR
ncbi:hypothetical protein ONZ45_g18925 [Pleurotus djamor]|nr:hypothetical protein ONZ45_g18925 [Pleurotus djamor]